MTNRCPVDKPSLASILQDEIIFTYSVLGKAAGYVEGKS